MNILRSPTWSVYDGEGEATEFSDNASDAFYVPYVSEAPAFLTLRSSGLKKETFIRHGAQSAVYAAYEGEEGNPAESERTEVLLLQGLHAATASAVPDRPLRRRRRQSVAVKRLFAQTNDFGIRGIPETALRELTLLRLIQQLQDAWARPGPVGDGVKAAEGSLDHTARILALYRVVEAPHKELCLVTELCAMDLSRVVISHARKLAVCLDLDLARPFSQLPPPGAGDACEAAVHACPDTIRHVHRKRCPILSQMCVVRYLLRRLLRMVCFLHEECGIIHRDLKLSNILITEDGGLRLSDFGSARFRMAKPAGAAASTNNPTTTFVGDPPFDRKSTSVKAEMAYTPATLRTTKMYQAPECLLGDCFYSTTIDMWSVGVIFGEIIRQSHLFHGESELAVISEIWKLLKAPRTEETGSESDCFAALPPELSVGKSPSEGHHSEVVPSNTNTEEAGLRFKFPPSVLPEEGFDLLQRMLFLDHSRRITSREALHHTFLKFKGDQADDEAGAKLWQQKVTEVLNKAKESVAVQMPLLGDAHNDDACDDMPNFSIKLH